MPIEESNQKSRANLRRGIDILRGVVVACGIGVAWLAFVLADPMVAGYGLLLIAGGASLTRHRLLRGAITMTLIVFMAIDVILVPDLGMGLYGYR